MQLGARPGFLQRTHCKGKATASPLGLRNARPRAPARVSPPSNPGSRGISPPHPPRLCSSPCCSRRAFCLLRSSMSCWCVWFFRRMYWMYSVALSRIWARDACCNSGKRQRQDKDLARGVTDGILSAPSYPPHSRKDFAIVLRCQCHRAKRSAALVPGGDTRGRAEPRWHQEGSFLDPADCARLRLGPSRNVPRNEKPPMRTRVPTAPEQSVTVPGGQSCPAAELGRSTCRRWIRPLRVPKKTRVQTGRVRENNRRWVRRIVNTLE